MAVWSLFLHSGPEGSSFISHTAGRFRAFLTQHQRFLLKQHLAMIEHLEKTVQAQPDNLEAHLALAKAYSKLGRKEDARRERLLSLEMTKNDTAPITHP